MACDQHTYIIREVLEVDGLKDLHLQDYSGPCNIHLPRWQQSLLEARYHIAPSYGLP